MELRRPAPLTLDLAPTERETLLAALEIAGALAGGQVAEALRFAAECYDRAELAQAIDRLADRVFALGVPPQPPVSAALSRPALVAA